MFSKLVAYFRLLHFKSYQHPDTSIAKAREIERHLGVGLGGLGVAGGRTTPTRA